MKDIVIYIAFAIELLFIGYFHYDDTADIIWDMHQALRFELWKNQPEPKSHMTVNAFPAHQFGEEPLIKVTSKDE